jgi:tetratricopeptide (TPR) repeat protein
VVLPFTSSGAGVDTAAITARLTEALGEWDGVQVTDERATNDALVERGRRPLTLSDAVSIASHLGAGRLVWGDAARDGDSVIVRAKIYGPGKGTLLRAATIAFPANARPPQGQFRSLANWLLRGRNESPWTSGTVRQRQSLPAWLAYDHGKAAALQWDIATARRRFQDALGLDPDFAQAQLWLARTMIWGGEAPDAWRAAAKRAVELRNQLTDRDALAAEAQVAIADGRFPDACERYGRIVALDTTDFAGWFGLGECRLRDSVVVADGRSPSGYRFRSSWQRAMESYLHLIKDMPPPHAEFVYSRLSLVLHTQANELRVGRSPSGRGEAFGAYPARDADTLAFVPYPNSRLSKSVMPHSLLDAVQYNRTTLRDLYQKWASESPRSLDARVAFAALLETTGELTSPAQGEESAVSEIQAARALPSDSAEQLQLVQTELRLLAKRGDWRGAAMLADSIFRAIQHPAGMTAQALVGAAALTGRLRMTSEIFLTNAAGFEVAMANGQPLDIAPDLRRDLATLRAYAALGACADSMRTFPARVDRLLESYFESTRFKQAHDMLLRRPLSLATPCLGAEPLLGVSDGGDRLVIMQQAYARGDTRAVRAYFDSLRVARAGGRPGDVAIDYTFLEAWLLTQIGDSAAATRQLDRTLDALPTLGTYLLSQPTQAAGLVRAMILRAELANAAGDRAHGRQWANAVATIWRNADPELQPFVKRMRSIAADTQ